VTVPRDPAVSQADGRRLYDVNPSRRSVASALFATLLCLKYAASGIQTPAWGATKYPMPLGRVAVVSLFGTSIHVVHIGFTRFGNATYAAEVPDWQLDDHATALLLLALNAAGYSASPLSLGETHVEDLYSHGMFPVLDTAAVLRLARDQGFDSVLFIERMENHTLADIPAGPGLLAQTALGIYRVYPYAGFFLRVLDVKSGDKKTSARNCSTQSKPDKTLLWKPTFAEYSADERAAIKGSLELKIDEELRCTLDSAGVVKSSEPNTKVKMTIMPDKGS
jgi:hypothetical protein